MASLAVSVDVEFGAGNPFYAASDLPFGAPPFDRIKDEDYAPAFAAGMAEHAREIRAIAENAEPAAFANTVVAMERTGELLDRVGAAFGVMAGAYTNSVD